MKHIFLAKYHFAFVVSIPKRVSEALKLNLGDESSWYLVYVSIPKRVSVALKLLSFLGLAY